MGPQFRRLNNWPEVPITSLEQAAAQQARALAKLRQAQYPTIPLSSSQRGELVGSAVENLAQAQGLLRKAQQAASGNIELVTLLGAHLLRLGAVIESTEWLLQTLRAEELPD
jgi:ABC-type hemin transport system substrate-binding protein